MHLSKFLKAASSGAIARPQNLRNMGQRHGYLWISIGLGVSVGSAFLLYFLYARPRNQKFDDFFRTVDPYKMYENICSKNALVACPENLAKRRAGEDIPDPLQYELKGPWPRK